MELNTPYCNARQITHFGFDFVGSDWLAHEYQRAARNQRALGARTRRNRQIFDMALWHELIRSDHDICIQIVPESIAEQHRSKKECSSTVLTHEIIIPDNFAASLNHQYKNKAFFDLIEQNWSHISRIIGNQSLSISHIIDNILDKNWNIQGRITEFSFNRNRSKCAAIYFDVNCNALTLKLAVLNRNKTAEIYDIYKSRFPSARILTSYCAGISWPKSNKIRVKSMAQGIDLMVPVDGFKIDYKLYEEITADYTGRPFQYENSNTPLLIQQGTRISKSSIRQPAFLTLTSTQEPVQKLHLKRKIGNTNPKDLIPDE